MRKRNTNSGVTLMAPPRSVEAGTYQEMYDNQNAGTGMRSSWWRITGRHDDSDVGWGDIIGAFVLEMFGSMLLGIAVALVKWRATSADFTTNALSVALAFFGVHLLMSRMYTHHALRRHLNGAVTCSYFFTHDIGFAGVLLYTLAQWAGIFAGGPIVSLFLSAVDPWTVTAASVPVPLPLATSVGHTIATTLAITCAAEIVMGALPLLARYWFEFVNTDESSEEARNLNYDRATLWQSLAHAALIFFLFQFQFYSFSTTIYGVALFSGWNMPYLVNENSGFRDTVNMARLGRAAGGCDPAATWCGYPNSVFESPTAWPLYTFGPVAAGLLGVVFVYIAWWLVAKTADGRYLGNAKKPFFKKAESQIDVDLVASEQQQQPLVNMVGSAHPSHTTQLLTPFAR